MSLSLLVLCLSASAADPKPWPGRVRVQGTDATGNGPRWDPALTDERPAYDRELAWDAANGIETQMGAWYQRAWGLRILRAPRTLDPDVLEADRAHIEAFFHDRAWREATVTVRREPNGRPGIEDVFFVVEPGGRDDDGPIAPDRPVRQSGWDVSPLISALARGTALSVYGGIRGDWLEDSVQPRQVVLHGELGLRAFGDPTGDVAFNGNVGPWSDGHVELVEGIGDSTGLFTRVGATTNLWPTVGEGGPEGRVGFRWGRFRRVGGDIAVGVGRWTSWRWPEQITRYTPWFGGDPVAPGQRSFLPSYSYARLDLTLVADSTDRDVLPRRGARLAVSATPIGLASTDPFFRGDVDIRGFVPLGSQRWVWGIRAEGGGLAFQNEGGEGLLGERFFLGAVDMRPWGRRKVVPPSYGGDAYDLRPGGNLVTYGNTDLTWHLHRDLALIAFVDAGRVWESIDEITLDALLVDVGASAALRCLGSSLRLDLAIRPTQQDIDSGPFGIQLWLNLPW